MSTLLPSVVLIAASTLAAGSFTEKDARTLADQVSVSVERLRGLKFTKPVALKLVDDAAARKHFKARLDKFWPTSEVALEQRAYVELGLLPHGADVVADLLDLLEEQAGGYYDPEHETFFILKDMPRAAAPILMAHELTHALDDQHFDLDRILGAASTEDDRGTALGAVVEGSGTLVMSAYMIREMEAGRLSRKALVAMQESEAGRARKLKEASPLLQRLLMAPYLLGPSFLERGDVSRLSSGVLSPADIDRVFKDPPASTEQILHPDKYWDEARRDEPQDVTVPDLSAKVGAGFKLTLTGSLGELTMALLTGAPTVDPTSSLAFAPSSWTTSAAAGWDGDRLQLYQKGDEALVVLATVWDSARDAGEFEASLARTPERSVARREDRVVVAAGGSAKQAAAAAAAALEAMDTAAAKATEAPKEPPAAGAVRSR